MSEDYNLKTSEQGIGQLYPVLVDKNGNVIDGFHRLADNPEWRKEKLEHIDSEEKLLVARAVANWNRRQVSREEKEEWINGLAEIYREQGYKISYRVGSAQAINQIKDKIVEVTGLSDHTILSYLQAEFKQVDSVPPKPQSKIPASERIEHELGEEYVARHRQEIIETETPRIKEEIKKELLKSPEFQREIIHEIQKPTTIKPTEACPSGVCELPSIIESGEPIDVIAESLTIFWENNPKCKCKTCDHFKTCGVIR